MSYDVFISYRRDGGDTLAQLVYDRLREKGYRIFLDIESLRSGKFNEKLLEVMDECKDVIVILPPNALERCNNPGDWLYREVSYALQHKKNIIPIMMKGFEWPEEWPEGMEELQNYNGIYDSKDYFDAVIDKIISLLSSKADLRGMKREKSRMNRQKKLERLKKKSTIVIGVLLAALLAAGAAFGYRVYQRYQEEDALSKVTIYLTPDEDMNVSEYHGAVDVIEERLDILMDGKSYGFDAEEARLKIQMPLEMFADVEPMNFMRSYVSRPIDLYLLQESTETYIPLDKDDIVSIEQLKGKLDDEIEESLYTQISLSNSVMKELKKTFAGNYDDLILIQDKEMGSSKLFGYYLKRGEKENQFYFVDEMQSEAVNALVEYNYTHESFEQAFTISVEMPVEWEQIQLSEQPGVHQCNIEDLPENHISVQYKNSSTSMTRGEYMDMMTVIKKRLDGLGQPYSIGKTVSGEYDFTIATTCEYVNEEILTSLMYGSITIGNPFARDNVSFSGPYNEIRYEKKEDGNYILKASTTNDYYIKSWNDMVDCILESENHNLYLYYNDYRLAQVDVKEQEEQIRKGEIIFENLSGAGYKVLDEEIEPFLNYLTVYSQDNLYERYDYTILQNDKSLTYGLLFEIYDVTDIEAVVSETFTRQNTWIRTDKVVYVRLEEAEKDASPTQYVDIIKQLYKTCGLKYGEVEVDIITVLDGDTFFSIWIKPDSTDYHGMKIQIWGSEGWEEFSYAQEVKQLLETDEFFKSELPYFE